MATKLYNSHLNKILFQCNEYYILDTYITLVHISSEVNNKYLIQSYSDSKSDLIALVKKHVNTSYKTIYNCIEKLIELDILCYNTALYSWSLVDMELMTKSKNEALQNNDITDNYSGYTHIRSFFFSNEFFNMKAREKRLMIYMAQLADSKASNFHESFSMNLLKPNSGWLKVLRTKCKYYAKYTIENMLKKYIDIFENKTDEYRSKDIAPTKNKNFKFFFNCKSIKDKAKEDDSFELIKITNPNEYTLVMDKIRFAEITLSKQKIMHLIRSISTLKEWFLKERVVQLIINKYIAIQVHKSRDDIKSLPAYAAAVVRSVVNEYKQFKEHLRPNNVKIYEFGEYFIDYVNNDNDNISRDIEYSLSLV